MLSNVRQIRTINFNLIDQLQAVGEQRVDGILIFSKSNTATFSKSNMAIVTRIRINLMSSIMSEEKRPVQQTFSFKRLIFAGLFSFFAPYLIKYLKASVCKISENSPWFSLPYFEVYMLWKFRIRLQGNVMPILNWN